MKVLLLDPRLHFISTGRGKMHAADSVYGQRPLYTMCGRPISEATEPHTTRQYSISEQLCGRCLMSLRTYTGDKVRFEREATA